MSTFDDSSLLSNQNNNQFLMQAEELNFRFFIQPLETLLVELTGTHIIYNILKWKFTK